MSKEDDKNAVDEDCSGEEILSEGSRTQARQIETNEGGAGVYRKSPKKSERPSTQNINMEVLTTAISSRSAKDEDFEKSFRPKIERNSPKFVLYIWVGDRAPRTLLAKWKMGVSAPYMKDWRHEVFLLLTLNLSPH
jgi:hypothetical protein